MLEAIRSQISMK